MIGHLYRYPHPHDPTRFIYVGQGPNRDFRHRKGSKGFGRRFKKAFPNIELPQPIREMVEVENQIELNELETIWMFRFHTWRGYPDGMNLSFPGSADYKIMGEIGGAIGGPIGGAIVGKMLAENGFLESLRTPEHQRLAGAAAGKASVKNKTGINNPDFDRTIAGRKGGLKNVESGHLQRISSAGGKVAGVLVGQRNSESGWMSKVGKMQSFEVRSERGKRVGPYAMHIRWHINRGVSSPNCAHCAQV